MMLEQAEIMEQRQLLGFSEFPPKVNIWRSKTVETKGGR